MKRVDILTINPFDPEWCAIWVNIFAKLARREMACKPEFEGVHSYPFGTGLYPVNILTQKSDLKMICLSFNCAVFRSVFIFSIPFK